MEMKKKKKPMLSTSNPSRSPSLCSKLFSDEWPAICLFLVKLRFKLVLVRAQ